MAEIVNLRMARKARSRAQKARQSAENRAKFGESKIARLAHRKENERTDRTLDNAKLDHD
ncbi:hypothetical protein FHS61_001743 [Altererythrobacter atlanticus]|uniref:Uncharacterized protein n=1 Tax=Croceibacterium atlanticum TaxID=1267766 RepID=A0A0F7KQ06_9SPHN|nr:DUF4169 family protein [Croceibacterium atlanticum]AKH41216.1 hypothetical protein WYH_00150 [Croceibacterium atlanticum]MBB5732734.1 hypothetical protein [Croceibacterium atlanticum]